MSVIMLKSWPSSCQPLLLSQSAWLLTPSGLFSMIQPTNGPPESRQHLKALPIPWLALFLFISLFAVHVRIHALQQTFEMWHQCVFVCVLWSKANTLLSTWRMRIVCGKRGRAILTSLGQVANSFHCVYLLPGLPSSSTYCFHPLTDPSDRGPVLALLHPTTRHLSLCKRRGECGLGVRNCVSKDESCVNSAVINKRLMWTMNHLRGLCVSAKAVQKAVFLEDKETSRGWWQECVAFIRSLPCIRQELQQGTARWSTSLVNN